MVYDYHTPSGSSVWSLAFGEEGMICNYVVQIVGDSPNWPPSVDETGKPQYFFAGGLGSCSVIGQAPQASTCIGQISTSPENPALIQADGRWEFLEEIEEAVI